MASEQIGKVKAGSGKSYEVRWDSSDRTVYVAWGGLSDIGKASSPGEAMRKAEAWLYDK